MSAASTLNNRHREPNAQVVTAPVTDPGNLMQIQAPGRPAATLLFVWPLALAALNHSSRVYRLWGHQ